MKKTKDVKSEREDKAIKKIENLGTVIQLFGYFKIFGVLIIFLLGFVDPILSKTIHYGYGDVSMNIFVGTIFVILGSRISKEINRSTKKYIWIVSIISFVLGILGMIMNPGKGITILLFFYAIFSLLSFNHIKIKKGVADYKLKGRWWVLLIGGFVLITFISMIVDVMLEKSL